MKRSEQVKLTAIGDDEMLMFAVIDRKFHTATSIPAQKRTATELALKAYNRNFFLMDFFSSQAQFGQRWSALGAD
jgi:hypothetical protein